MWRAAAVLSTTSLFQRASSFSSPAARNMASFDPTSFYSAPQPPETSQFMMQQTMIRVKDPQTSLDFYTGVLGFKLVMHRDFPQWGFSVYFVAHGLTKEVPEDADERWNMCMTTPGCVELTWNHGSESAQGLVYNTGNSDSTGAESKVKGGFGHLGITVPDVYEACEGFLKKGATFHKSPNSGGMKGLAFVKDPDGYLIEVLPQGPMIQKPIDCCGVAVDGGEGYKDNSK